MKVKSESEVAQYPTLSDPMDCSLPGSSVHRIFQARVLQWGAIAFSEVCGETVNMKKQEDRLEGELHGCRHLSSLGRQLRSRCACVLSCFCVVF